MLKRITIIIQDIIGMLEIFFGGKEMNEILKKVFEITCNNFNIIKNDWIYILCASVFIGGIIFSFLKFLYKERLDRLKDLKAFVDEKNKNLRSEIDDFSEKMVENENFIKETNVQYSVLKTKYTETIKQIDEVKEEKQNFMAEFKHTFEKMVKIQKAKELLNEIISLSSEKEKLHFEMILNDYIFLNMIKNHILFQAFKEDCQSIGKYKEYFDKLLSKEEILLNYLEFMNGSKKLTIDYDYDKNSIEIKQLIDEFIEKESIISNTN